MLFTNGTFIGANKEEYTSALVDDAGNITGLFNEVDVVRHLQLPALDIVDMRGAWIMPPFEDAHNHLAARARTLFELDFRKVTISWLEVKERIRKKLSSTVPGSWVVCHGWNQSTWGQIEQAELDELSGECGIFLINISFHGGLVNSRGVSILERDGYSVPKSGEVTEEYFEMVIIATSPTVEQYMEAIPKLQRRLLSLGVGAVHDMHILTLDQLEAYHRLEMAQGLFMPVVLYVNPRLLQFPKELTRYIEQSGTMAAIVGLKLFLDGAIGTSTAAVQESYSDGTGGGVLRLTREQCVEYIEQAVTLGLRHIAMHCIGGRAVDLAVKIFTELKDKYRSQIDVWRFEHFEMPSARAIATIAQYGGVASMQPNFSWDIENYKARLGNKAYTVNPLRAVVDAQVRVVLSSDDAPSGPLTGIQWAAIIAPTPLQQLTLDEALTYYTKTPAQIAGAGSRRGVLGLGYEANFVVLNQNPYATESWSADTLQIQEVWLKGQRLFGN